MTQVETQYGLVIPYDKTLEELIQLTKEKAPLCWTAYTALAQNDSDKIISVFEILLENKDWTHIRSTIEAIGKNKYGLHFENRLIDFLNSPNTFIVTSSIKALANLRSEKSHNKIKALIDTEILEIKQTAIEGISKLWQSDDFNFLIEIDKKIANENIRKAIGFVLAEHIDKDNWKLFFEHYYKDKISRHREWSLICANQFSNDKTFLDLFLNDSDGHIRKKANKFKEQINCT